MRILAILMLCLVMLCGCATASRNIKLQQPPVDYSHNEKEGHIPSYSPTGQVKG